MATTKSKRTKTATTTAPAQSDYDRRKARFAAMVENAAELAFAKYARSMSRLYLYYRAADQSAGKWGELLLACDWEAPDGAELACAEYVPMSLPMHALYGWIRERVCVLPLIGD